MLERIPKKIPKIGVFAVAHGTYWAQFEGLKDNMEKYHADLISLIAENEVEIVDLGIVDESDAGFRAAERFNAENVDLIFCNMITYATSSVFAPVLRNCSAPMVLVALQPRSAMDYEKANTFMQLENDNICSVPEFCGVALRMNKTIHDVIVGKLYNDDKSKQEIAEWCTIARALRAMKGARIGLMGHVLEAMYDMHTDPTAFFSAFGIHVPLLEVDDLLAEYKKVTDEEIEREKQVIINEFDMPDPKSDPLTMKLTDEDLYKAARASVALEHFRVKYKLDGLAYFYNGGEGSEHRMLASSLILGNSMLIARGIPMCGEYDIKTCLAMYIMDSIGIGGSFAEIHPFDFDDDCILVGHDGPHHIQLAQGKPVVRSLKKYHGKEGSGASVEFKIKEGPITMFGITQTANGKFKFVIGEGISKKGPIPPTGNTNTRGFFAPTTKEFVKKWVMEGPTHHYALGIGHHADEIAKIAEILGIEYVIVK